MGREVDGGARRDVQCCFRPSSPCSLSRSAYMNGSAAPYSLRVVSAGSLLIVLYTVIFLDLSYSIINLISSTLFDKFDYRTSISSFLGSLRFSRDLKMVHLSLVIDKSIVHARRNSEGLTTFFNIRLYRG